MTQADAPQLIAALDAISASDASKGFNHLVAISGLDPSTDFRRADFSGVDLSHQNLAAFDFSFARFKGALVQGAIFNTTVRPAQLSGAIGAPSSIRQQLLKAPIWLGHEGELLKETLRFMKMIEVSWSHNLSVVLDFRETQTITPRASFLITCLLEANMEIEGRDVRLINTTGDLAWLSRGESGDRGVQTYAFDHEAERETQREAVQELVDWTAERAGRSIAARIYEIVSELLLNIAQHAGRGVDVYWKIGALYDGEFAHLAVVDFGVGMTATLSDKDLLEPSDAKRLAKLLGDSHGEISPRFERGSGLAGVLTSIIETSELSAFQIITGDAEYRWDRQPMSDREGEVYEIGEHLNGTGIFISLAPTA